MGGSITVGLRRSDGREYWMNRWTNVLKDKMFTRGFMDEGQNVDDFVREVLPGEKSHGDSYLHKRARLSSYGVVLIDFKLKKIVSANEYTSFDREYLWWPEDLKELKRLMALGWAKKIELFERGEPGEESTVSTVSCEEFISNGPRPVMATVLCELPLEVTEYSDGKLAQRKVLHWAGQNGWALRTNDQVS